jgi:hypothetical protein
MTVSDTAKVELCGIYAGNNPPIAITALPNTGVVGTQCTNAGWPCAAVITASPDAFYVQGTTYLPDRELVLALDNGSAQFLRGGVIVRRMWASTSRTAATPVIETPSDPYTVRRTVVYLNVYVCPGTSTCASGQLQLRSKVSIIDPSPIPVAGDRRMTVLSWSTLR